MDEYLAQIYGTGTGASDDLEKTAQAAMLQKLAEDEGIDLSGLSEEQLDALAQQVVSDQDGAAAPDDGAQAADNGVSAGDANAEEEAQAKFAEADFLGRVMAHSYTQELNKIAQEEGGAPPFPPKAEAKKCEDCGKADCECPKKEASGPLAAAIQRLGGSVGNTSGNTAAYVEKLAESRAEELAVGWLQQNGYIK